MKHMLPLTCFFRSCRTWFTYLACAAVGLALNQAEVHAATIFATELSNNAIVSVDTVTNTVNVVTSADGPDSLIFTPAGNIIYSDVFAGDISLYNATTHTTSVIASGLNIPQDLALDPGGATFVFSDSGNGRILRESVTGGPFTVVNNSPGTNPTGLAYDASGDLFVVRGEALDQINPITGTVMNSINLPVAGDGLTYDPVSGNLFMSFTSGIVSVPTNLSSFNVISTGTGDRIDGVEADGLGNIYLADTDAQRIVEFNGTTFTNLTVVPTIDDLAPVVGLGSSVPEPASGTLLGLGIACLLGYTFRRKSASGAA